jgi:hypothetical protein
MSVRLTCWVHLHLERALHSCKHKMLRRGDPLCVRFQLDATLEVHAFLVGTVFVHHRFYADGVHRRRLHLKLQRHHPKITTIKIKYQKKNIKHKQKQNKKDKKRSAKH